ncbi:hypothetical protein [uncultured Hyphomicrobium sp.]|uniref:hypothetical protein n=1 Tax=uncultured Hyphomicrobium sp. TaxID=194373 RepID=UPI0025ED29C5|nr:hypothetical protein [uncultured Hyphomicrobium sp.]
MSYQFEIVRYPIQKDRDSVLVGITQGVTVGEGVIAVASEAGHKIAMNHLAMRSDIARNGDNLTVTETHGYRYSIQWKRSPRGKHADKFRSMRRDVFAANPTASQRNSP